MMKGGLDSIGLQFRPIRRADMSALWLEVSEHKEQKQYETMVDEALKRQNQFQESITKLIEVYASETERLRAVAESQASGS